MPITPKTLTPEQQELLTTIHQIGFGRIESLAIIDGQPRILPETRIVRRVLVGAERGTGRADPPGPDERLKRQFVDLFLWFQQVEDGYVRRLDVQHSLPATFELEYQPCVA